MSKIKNDGLNQYGAKPFEQQRFETAGVEGVKSRDFFNGSTEPSNAIRHLLPQKRDTELTSWLYAIVIFSVLSEPKPRNRPYCSPVYFIWLIISNFSSCCLHLLLRPLYGCGVLWSNRTNVCLSVRERISGTAGPIFPKFGVQIPVAVTRSSSGGIALSYVLQVLWMMSGLAVVNRIALRGRPDLLVAVSVTCATGAESDVYECSLYLSYIVLSVYIVCISTLVYIILHCSLQSS